MPQRHSTGSSGSSSSSGSSYRSSGSSSSGSSGSNHDYNNGNREPASPEQQALSLVILGIMVVVLAVLWVGDQVKKSNETRQKADATRTTQAITLQDLAEMNAALHDRIPSWMEVQDLEVHHISASDAGFKPNSNTKEVVYGYCEKDVFYVYVIEESTPGGFTVADSEGYAYTPKSYPGKCRPKDWSIVDSDNVGSGWYFVTIRTSNATLAVQRTMFPSTQIPATRTPIPTPSLPATLSATSEGK